MKSFEEIIEKNGYKTENPGKGDTFVGFNNFTFF